MFKWSKRIVIVFRHRPSSHQSRRRNKPNVGRRVRRVRHENENEADEAGMHDIVPI